MSAIVTLQEMGLTEVRLRDTLMRATNATELFSRAQETAATAWEENTALANEANKRYATTESRLTNLKNTALLTAQQIGDDLNPTIQNLIDGATDLLNQIHGAGRRPAPADRAHGGLCCRRWAGVADVGENHQRCGHIVHRHRQVCHCRGQGGRRLEGVLFDAVQIPPLCGWPWPPQS